MSQTITVGQDTATQATADTVQAAPAKKTRKKAFGGAFANLTVVDKVVLTLFGIFLAMPLAILLVFSFSRGWTNTLFPPELTLDYWISAVTSSDIQTALLNSIIITVAVTAINVVLVIPATYASVIAFPKIRPVLHGLAIIPFALPWIVIASGMQMTVKEFAPELFGTFFLLIITLTGVTFPYLYWNVENSLITHNATGLAEAARMSGAGPFRTLVKVLIPCAKTGLMTGCLLVSAAVFGEYAITMTLVGGAFETLPLWTLRAFGGRMPGQGQELAAVSFATFAILFVISLFITRIDTNKPTSTEE